MTADSRRALRRLQDSAQHPDHSCFSRTIRAEKTENRSLPDGKRNMIDSRKGAEALRQSFHFDHRLSHKERIWKPGNQEGILVKLVGSWLPDFFSGFQIHFTFGK